MLDSDDIQGNIVPGFLKPFQRLIGLSIVEVPSAQAWLRQLAPRLTTLRQAMQTREEVRRHRGMRRALTEELNPVPGSVDDAWINIAFSYRGLRKLFAADEDREAQLKQFQDEAFPLGLAARSAALGDPTDPHLPGHPQNWRVGGVSGEPDILLIFAADRYERLDELSSSIGSDGLQHVYEENARKLDPRGAEHFGFKDGVSQPGVRGRYSDEADAFVTQRVVAPDGNRQSLLYGLPGQRLIWPGEFIFGYPRQCADPLIPGPANLPGPDWSRNGSYLVFRRLQQDVQGFRDFLRDQAETLRAQQRMSEMTTERL
ncbi:MAG TPA: hypothetical protein VE219_04220, partial [Candidatus Sulfotelmatobacter sp.]|nr:hypothetical protein [Candidatus Sulfotelmatobacter sp.]